MNFRGESENLPKMTNPKEYDFCYVWTTVGILIYSVQNSMRVIILSFIIK